eukprot:5427751-Amphidinium_carterae.1
MELLDVEVVCLRRRRNTTVARSVDSREVGGCPARLGQVRTEMRRGLRGSYLPRLQRHQSTTNREGAATVTDACVGDASTERVPPRTALGAWGPVSAGHLIDAVERLPWQKDGQTSLVDPVLCCCIVITSPNLNLT